VNAMRRYFSFATFGLIWLCLSIATPVTAQEVILTKAYAGNIDYVANGASFRDNEAVACSLVSPMSSTINLSIPVGANILDAFLYYAGSADIGPVYHSQQIDLSSQTSLTLNNVSIPTTPGFNGVNFANILGVGGGVVDFFGARRDVSNIVTGGGAYTLAGMVVHTEAQARPPTGTCLAAWGLVVIYEDPNVSNVRVINLFDGFKAFQNQSFDLNPRNFVVGGATPTGKMTHMTYEGDNNIASAGETFELQIGTSAFTQLNSGAAGPTTPAGTVTDPSNINPTNNQYNGTITGPDVFDNANSPGFDLDTYAIQNFVNLSLQSDSFDATTRYNTGQDLVLLMSEIISIDNKALADIEVTLNDVGLFNQGAASGAQYLISVQNNGDGLTLPSTGSATGFIYVYDDLPTGISIDSPTDITAPGWDCSATNFTNNEVRCRYTLSNLPGGKLDRGQSLPDITVTADVGAAITGSVTNRAHVSLCDSITGTDTCVNFTEKHTDANEFDQKNFFEDTALPPTIFSVLQKSIVNNNVDRVITPIIVGASSDLSTSTKTVANLNGPSADPNDVLQYTITLKESDNAQATGVEISDVIDINLDLTLPVSTSVTTDCGGTLVASYSFGTLTVTGLTVPANGQCNVTYTASIKNSAVPGTVINNTAAIANGNGVDGNAVAPSVLIAGAAAGNKQLYLDNLNTTRNLSRAQPTGPTSTTLADGVTTSISLLPILAGDLDVSAGVIPVNLWIETNSNTARQITVRLRSSTAGAGGLIAEQTLSNIVIQAGVANAQLVPFQLPRNTAIADFNTGEAIFLEVVNTSGAGRSIIVHSVLQSTDSSVGLSAQNVINVDDISFYTDPGLSSAIVGGEIEAGQVIYIAATISDPFGFADITGARLTLIDPNLANQLTNVAMTQNSNTVGTKTYVYAYTTPAAASVAPGIWVAQVTGIEGVEGTVTHTDANNFTTTAPEVSVVYTVDLLTADPGDTLTYTITITNGGAATPLDISQLLPNGTTNWTLTSAANGTSNSPDNTTINITGITADPGTTIITFTVVVGGAQPGDLIDHTISLDNMGTAVTDPAPSVLISPFGAPAGNKTLYADAFGTSGRFDRTLPVLASNTTRTITGQGGSRTFTLSPVLQSALTLTPGTIASSLWVSRGTGSFAGTRVINAELGYTGAASGTIGTPQSITINLDGGATRAQYIPFNFSLPATLVLPANTSLTLKVTNDTSVSGETIFVHTIREALPTSPSLDNDFPSRINLNATAPLTVTAVEFLNNSMDSGGTIIPSAGLGDTIWVRATVQDPFGRADITGATVTITDPTPTAVATDEVMTIPTAQPASGAQRYFEYSQMLTGPLGDWTAVVTAVEGNEGIVSASNSGIIDVNNDSPDLTDSYKFVTNTTTGDNANVNPGDTLHYTIELVEIGGAAASGVTLTDVIPANTTFVDDSLFVDAVLQANPNPTGTISLTGLTVPISGTSTIEFDVTIDGATPVGTIISNSAVISGSVVPDIIVNAEDLVISGVPAAGTKLLYLENLNTGSPVLTRAEPVDGDAGTTDRIELQNAGGAVTLTLDVDLAKDITLEPDANPVPDEISVTLRLQASGADNRSRSIQVDLGYENGGGVTSLGSNSQSINLVTGTVTSHLFSFPVAASTTIPAGNRLVLTITNNESNNNRDMFVYSFDSIGNRSNVALVPSPVINVDSITFWTDTLGAGTQITNPNPTSPLDIYARVVISDPFGELDIQAPDAPVNQTTEVITAPDGVVTNGGDFNDTCTAPCYAYMEEDITNDVDPATRTFYYIIRLDSAPPSTRGTWTMQVTANEGREVGAVSHTSAGNFTTALAANLSTSTKTHNVVGDVTNGSQIIYTITITNTGALAADNVTFSDTLQTSVVPLTFVSAGTTCTDETASALPNPAFSGGVVTLSNISVTAGNSCAIAVTVSVGSGTAGDLINNSAVIVNPGGVGATPAAPTVIYEASQVPSAGSKQLYLDNMNVPGANGGTGILTRTQPTATDVVTLDEDNDTDDIELTLNNVTTGPMTLAIGAIDVNLLLSESGNGSNRQTRVEVLVDPNDGGGYQVIDSLQLNLSLTGTASIRTFSLTNSTEIPLAAGSSFRIRVQNNQNQNNRVVLLHQATSAPFSELVVPLIDAISVTELKFFDVSATDNTGNPGCEATFSCGAELDPGTVLSGGTLWARTIITDGFGAFDVNTGSQVCTDVIFDNCPQITVTNPASGSTIFNMAYVNEPDTSSRRYEYEVNPGGFGLEGIWQVEVLGSEGVEGVVTDTALNTFERYGLPILTIVKLVDGVSAATKSPNTIASYTNDVSNTGLGPATSVVLTNMVGDFVDLELVNSGGIWTALFSLSGLYTVSSESFSIDGSNFTYDPNTTGVCTLPIASPCYDPAITHWRILLNENIPVGDSLTQGYRARVE
jgi:uncharacterized repeat protein (TIGR01451 family)/fimbrial isopeptide formation D2 family protein